MKNKFLSGTIALLMLFLGACQKEPKPSEATYVPITDQRLREAAKVKVGSYFVYQDSATGNVDSFRIISSDSMALYNEKKKYQG